MHDLFTHHLDISPDGVIAARALPTHGGVYLIADRDDRPILLACGEDLRRIVVHRFAAPPPEAKTKRANLAEIAGRIYWRDTFSRFETAYAHWQVARSLNPKGYRREIAFGPAWFLRVDPGERTPRFEPMKEFAADTARYFGPFATRRDADERVHLLEDVFDLCRYHPVLELAPHGQTCAYFEMGRCPAPCNGSIPLETYRRTIVKAAAFVAGDHEPRLAALHGAMQSAAGELAFEKAATIRQIIERARGAVRRPEYLHVADLSACCWLIVQRGGPARRSSERMLVKPFFLRGGTMEVGRPVAMAELDSVVPRWLHCCGPCSVLPTRSTDEQTRRCEMLWLVAKFLFQGEAAPGVFCRFDRLPPAEALSQAIRQRFARQEKTEDDPESKPVERDS
jgi:hypothetical protein